MPESEGHKQLFKDFPHCLLYSKKYKTCLPNNEGDTFYSYGGLEPSPTTHGHQTTDKGRLPKSPNK